MVQINSPPLQQSLHLREITSPSIDSVPTRIVLEGLTRHNKL